MKYLESAITYLENHGIQFALTIVIIIVFLIVRSVIRRLVRNHASTNEMEYTREVYIRKLIGGLNKLLFALLIGIVWEISLQGLSLYFASIFTVIGVGLFANWSILSNLTASIILFFFFPYRIGEKIKIVDGDNSVEGLVIDITLFYLRVQLIR
ncbi:MAG: mechanosensitive ion channel domain-containing protein [Bacteroidota bacterium]